MTSIFINDSKIDLSLRKDDTISDLMKSNEVAKLDKTITCVSLDEQNIFEELNSKEFLSNRLNNFKSIRITMKTNSELCIDALNSSTGYISDLISRINEAAVFKIGRQCL